MDPTPQQRILHPAWTAALCVVAAALLAPAGHGQSHGPVMAANPAPSAAQIQALVERAAQNQHNNDRAIEEYERIEHVVARKDSETSAVVSDHTDRIIPSGTGVMRIPIDVSGVPISQPAYRKELQGAIDALELYVHQNERVKQDLIKFEKRRHDRAELVDTATKAFKVTWAGRETRNGRTLAKLILESDPAFKPTSRITSVFEHVRAVLWVDEAEAQFARLEADITTDMAFAGGIAGKVYRGGHFAMEQSEIAPGIWLPTLYTVNMDGRKFMFSFAMHERFDVSGFRRLGPPAQAVELIRKDLNELVARGPAH